MPGSDYKPYTTGPTPAPVPQPSFDAAAAQVSSILRADPLRWHLLGMVRELGLSDCWIDAPFGLDDLLNLTLRPTPRFCATKRTLYEVRVKSKNCFEPWTKLKMVDELSLPAGTSRNA